MSVGIHTSKGFVKVAGVGMGASPMSGATENKDGAAGLVPAPSIADRDKFLRGDGNWAEVEQINTEEFKEYINTEISKVTDTLPTSEETANWNEHVASEHAPSDAEKNVVIGLTINGQDMPVSEARTINLELSVGDDGNLYITY